MVIAANDFQDKINDSKLSLKTDIVKHMILHDVKQDKEQTFSSRLREMAENDIEIDFKVSAPKV